MCVTLKNSSENVPPNLLLGITVVELMILHGVLKYLRDGTPPYDKKRVPEVVYIQA